MQDPADPWAHAAYPKMTESPSEWRLDLAAQRRVDRARWVVTEKLHGANFAVATDGQRFRFGKRKAWLGPEDDFFGYRRLQDGLRAGARAAFEALRAAGGELVRLDVCGELFGGGYPHPAVPATPGLQPVQTGVHYSPDLAFCVFDLRVWTTAGPSYLGWRALVDVCDAAGLARGRTLVEGTLAEALALDIEGLETGWPAQAGLPKLADNLAEGVVVRTAEELLLDTPRGPRRAMFKRKARRFTEDPRYHQAEAPAKAQSVAYGLDLLLWRADELLNANRLAAAVSKAGRPEGPAARAEVAGLLAEDVLEALGEAHPAELAALEASAQSTLRARVAEDARVLVDAAFGG